MKVLVAHNRYRSALPSGENRVVDDEIEMLREAGLEVEPYLRESDEIEDFTPLRKAEAAVRPIFSLEDTRAFRAVLRRFRPDVVHLHNPYPLLSPWIVRTARSEGVPVVQTVHNYRHICMSALYFRDGHVCQDCLGKAVPWPGVVHGCYRDSVAQSVTMAATLTVHRSTWQLIDRLLPVSEFVGDQLVAAGIPADRIAVKYNAVIDHGPVTPPGDGIAFVGRLDEVKGVRLLLDAWSASGAGSRSTLTIAGDGTLRPLVEEAVAQGDGVRYVGPLDERGVIALMDEAAAVVVPSLLFEGFPRNVVEAFSRARPVIATDVGALGSIVDERYGWSTPPRVDPLAAALAAATTDRVRAGEAGRNGRAWYEANARRDIVIERQIQIYREVIAGAPVPSEPVARRPVRGAVLLAGADGTGKSTVAAALAGRLREDGVAVEHTHFRPNQILPHDRAGIDVTEPHREPPRSLGPAAARTAVVLADFVVGSRTTWRRARRDGVLIAERGWIDQAVDPRRYRLPRRLAPLVGRLTALLPRYDVVAVLDGPAELVHARKPELPAAEIRRQSEAWRAAAPVAGRTVVTIDTTETDPDACAEQILQALAGPARSWRRVPLWSSRLDARATVDPPARAALGIYRPHRPRGAAVQVAGTALLRAGLARRAAPPDLPLDELLAAAGLSADGLATMASQARGRSIVGIEQGGRLVAVAKIGSADDDGLRTEADVLRDLHGHRGAVRTPELRWSGPVGSMFALVTEAVAPTGHAVTVDDALAAAIELHEGMGSGRAIEHGDLTPWNLLRTDDGLVLIDWEASRPATSPLYDLTWFVAQRGALLDAYSPAGAVDLLVHRSGPSLVRALGLDLAEVRDLVAADLEVAIGRTEGTSRAFRAEMVQILS